MTAQGEIHEQPGKARYFSVLFYAVTIQCIFYGSIAVSTYALVTLNFKLIATLIFIVLVQRQATRWQAFIRLLQEWTHPVWYFRSFRRIYEQPVTEQASMFCMHPHSVFSACLPSNMNADNSIMSSMTGLASRFILSLPIFGLTLRFWGIQSINPSKLKSIMQKNIPVGMCPGGFEEATLTTPKELRVFIKDRKGFLKYGLTYGYTIYPTLIYNEHKAFWTLDYFTKFRLLMNKIKMPSVLFGGGFLWVFIPPSLDMVTIVGKGISRKPSNVGKPVSPEELDQIHGEYQEQISRIHKKYREEFKESELVFY